MRARPSLAALSACFGAIAGCHERGAPEPPAPVSAPATPDRLAAGEHLSESETAFGLPLPAGMRLVRHFDDAAYFNGELAFDAVLEHVRARVRTEAVQLLSQGAVFPRAVVAGGDPKRLLRIELSEAPRGVQLHVKDITPPPAVTGVSEAEIWRKAGRNPDGTPIDQNTVY